MPAKILVVDDEKDIVDMVSYNLVKEGYAVQHAFDGEEALRMIQSQKPDIIILDLMLPGIQGMEVCKRIRKKPEIAHIPIIMLTAKGEEVDKIVGLEVGADDYVTKPFSVRELVARVRAVLRRVEARQAYALNQPFAYKGLTIDYQAHSVSVDGKRVELSPTEFKLLSFISQNPGRVYTRDQLLDYVWGNDAFVEPRTVDVHIRRLRAQIEKDMTAPRYVITVRGVGYKFADVK